MSKYFKRLVRYFTRKPENTVPNIDPSEAIIDIPEHSKPIPVVPDNRKLEVLTAIIEVQPPENFPLGAVGSISRGTITAYRSRMNFPDLTERINSSAKLIEHNPKEQL